MVNAIIGKIEVDDLGRKWNYILRDYKKGKISKKDFEIKKECIKIELDNISKKYGLDK